MPDDELVEDEIEIDLRDPSVVATRALVISAVCRRAYLELASQQVADEDEPEAERFDLLAWLQDEGLDRELTALERRLIETRVGGLGEAMAEEASWRTESLAALAWALKLVDALPPYDQIVDPSPLLGLIPAPWERTVAFRSHASLLPEAEVARERERAELWSWRAQAADVQGGDPPTPEATIREVARDAATAGYVPALIDGDFPARGHAYADLADDALGELIEIAAQRLQALNWVCGFGLDWDSVPLDI